MRSRALVPALLILAAVVGLSIAFTRLRRPQGPVVYADLRSAPGLREGAPAVLRGVTVGGVTNIAFVPGGVRLTITITRPDVPLRQGDGVRLRSNGILADVAVELVPGNQPALPGVDGTVLAELRPDSATLQREAIREALLRRIVIGPAGDSASKSPAGAAGKP